MVRISNLRQRVTATDPDGRQSVMAKLILGEQKKFPLAVIPKKDTYTIQFWIKGNVSTVKLYAGGTAIDANISVNGTWKKCLYKFEAETNSIVYMLIPAGTFFIWHDKLENSTIPSDYDRNETDSENYLANELVSITTAINQRVDGIELTASKTVARTDDLEKRMYTAESSLEVIPGQIEAKVSETDYTGKNLMSKINLAKGQATIDAGCINLKGQVVITGNNSMLDTESKQYLNGINSNASGALETVNGWKYPGKTTINGGIVETGTIGAEQINVNELFAKKITATDFNITGGSMKINNTYEVTNNGEVNFYEPSTQKKSMELNTRSLNFTDYTKTGKDLGRIGTSVAESDGKKYSILSETVENDAFLSLGTKDNNGVAFSHMQMYRGDYDQKMTDTSGQWYFGMVPEIKGAFSGEIRPIANVTISNGKLTKYTRLILSFTNGILMGAVEKDYLNQ